MERKNKDDVVLITGTSLVTAEARQLIESSGFVLREVRDERVGEAELHAILAGVRGYLIGGYVVRHHAAENVDSGFSFVPVVDLSTHSFGGSIALRPDRLEVPKLSRLMNRMSLK